MIRLSIENKSEKVSTNSLAMGRETIRIRFMKAILYKSQCFIMRLQILNPPPIAWFRLLVDTWQKCANILIQWSLFVSWGFGLIGDYFHANTMHVEQNFPLSSLHILQLFKAKGDSLIKYAVITRLGRRIWTQILLGNSLMTSFVFIAIVWFCRGTVQSKFLRLHFQPFGSTPTTLSRAER